MSRFPLLGPGAAPLRRVSVAAAPLRRSGAAAARLRSGVAAALLVGLLSCGDDDPEPVVPAELAAAVGGAAVEIAWTPPSDGAGNDLRLLRRQNTPPAGPDDPLALVVYAGPARTFADSLSGLLPDMPTIPRSWHYAAYACPPGGVCDTAAARAGVIVTLPQVLRRGGYTIHWRHSAADLCSDSTQFGGPPGTSHPDWWRSCNAECGPTSTARQLNDAGRAEAVAIGEALRALEVPFDQVLSSEFCRCFQTAELMDLGPTVETRPELTFSVYDEPNRCARSRELLALRPAAGMNRAMVGHAGYPSSCPDLGILAWSECAIFKPDGAGGMTLVGSLKWTDWDEIVAADGAPALSARYR